MPIPFLPIKLNATKKCERCGLRHEKALDACPHCADIPDGRALDQFIGEHQDRLKASGQLGSVFVVVFLILAVLLLLLMIQ